MACATYTFSVYSKFDIIMLISSCVFSVHDRISNIRASHIYAMCIRTANSYVRNCSSATVTARGHVVTREPAACSRCRWMIHRRLRTNIRPACSFCLSRHTDTLVDTESAAFSVRVYAGNVQCTPGSVVAGCTPRRGLWRAVRMRRRVVLLCTVDSRISGQF